MTEMTTRKTRIQKTTRKTRIQKTGVQTMKVTDGTPFEARMVWRVALSALTLGMACSDDEPLEGDHCDPLADSCPTGFDCAERVDGTFACHEPVLLRGTVADAATQNAIAGAHVIALDQNSVAVSDVTISNTDGSYSLAVPVLRDLDGTPVEDVSFTLRSSAADYQPFPSGIRTAIPVLSSEAVDVPDEGVWIIDNTLTQITLLALPTEQQGLATISGSVVTTDTDQNGLDDHGAGVLVVAHNGGTPAPTGISDRGGHFTIFNVGAGNIEVWGYKAGIQLDPANVTVDRETIDNIQLRRADLDTSNVSGSINIVNAPGGSTTSVVLAVRDTFVEGFGRGEVGAGLRTPLNVDGAWSIAEVPAGDYVVLAAFENDHLVRDPDQNIAGTQTVFLTVNAGEPVELADAFKITEALDVFEPGEELPTPAPSSSPPTLTWADDSSEDGYSVHVYNAFGDLVWEDDAIPNVSGSSQVERLYEGPMEIGMYYQFRAFSFRAPGGQTPSRISGTEDLRGVFYVVP